jgi:hypothetical protein
MKFLNRFLLAPCLALAAVIAIAQPVADTHRVIGFRSAHFGMDEAQVRSAIAQDFEPVSDNLSMLKNPAENTELLLLRVAELEPGPGPASVSYIFGAKSRRLMHINVVWKTDETPSDEARNKIAAAGMQLTNYFRDLSWKPGASASGLPNGGNGLVLFAGLDPSNAGVEVRVSGVTTSGAESVASKPEGPAQLVLSYVADIKNPDIAVIKPGAF